MKYLFVIRKHWQIHARLQNSSSRKYMGRALMQRHSLPSWPRVTWHSCYMCFYVIQKKNNDMIQSKHTMIEYTLQIATASWGQKGVPHPQAIHACFFGSYWPNAVDLRWKRLSPRQAPDVRKARMYKVLKEVVEDNQKGTKNETSVPYLYICLAIELIDVVFLNMFFSEKTLAI